MKKKLGNHEFYQTLISLVLPITLQSLISSSLNMVDNLMIGKLGESAIASVGLVNQYFFVFTLCLSGFNAGAGIFISQYWGRKNSNNIRRMLGLNMILCILASLVFSIPAFLFPQSIMRIFTHDAEVIYLGVQYLRIIAVTFILTSITQAYATTLRCIGIANPPMIGSLVGVLTNAFLNWIFIYGNLGVPAMGVAGAALATSIARLVEMLIIIYAAYRTNEVIPAKIKQYFSFNMDFVKAYFQVSSAVIINELVWSLGLTCYSIIYAKIGIQEVASMQISTTINNMFMVLCTGLANSASIIVGNCIGAGNEDTAKEYSTKLSILAPVVGLITGMALWIFSPSVVGLFNIEENTVQMTINVLRIMSVFAPLRFFNVLMIVGIFRGGGDTKYSMLVQLGTIWFFAIPLGYTAAVFLKQPLEIVFAVICLEEIVKFIFEAKRLRSKKWLKNVIDNTGSLRIEMN
ncbi:MATE family efflux transporter [Tissierella sp. Yu-01]|uniref:MATE family efflux transporter n=1 Tax=Tissierella sp. Yu-01 TaxID=3035694 RepID=UPI00240DF65A|nr:MATE family efflux transporter [Tissierella sp. Yu-01]WFA09072.1 MATE family efflux transporter [Tissierella sp. Yu-01]